MDELSESYWGPREITSHVINLGWKTKEIVQLPQKNLSFCPVSELQTRGLVTFLHRWLRTAKSFNLPLSLFNKTFFLLILDILSLWDRKLSE